MQRLGFFGGCFNPPTIAHYKLALKAVEVADLDKLYFVPMGDYYYKEELVASEDRFQMLKIMVQNETKLDVSRIQMDQKKELQAIDTFRLIQQKYYNSQKFFIMGSDNFEKIVFWKCAKELLNSYQYIVLNRGNFESNKVLTIDFDNNLKNISSSLVREKIQNGDSIKDLVTKDVEKYILEKGLYK